MTLFSSQTIDLARKLREDLAGPELPRSFAKLYSQHTRLSANQPGLTNWHEGETIECLNDAVRLLEAAFVEREADNENWRNSVRRASELLEWLSHPQLNPSGLPLLLLSAASYQLAGYPARSLGLLNSSPTEDNESRILRSLLKADFPSLLSDLSVYWAEHISLLLQAHNTSSWTTIGSSTNQIQQIIVRETASTLGVLCAEMKWGNELRLNRALQKLSDIGKVFLHGYDAYSWLLAKLCTDVASVYADSSMRHQLQNLMESLTQEGQEAVGRYLHYCYLYNKALAWPSQVRGIEKLLSGQSFALCTPTGSGKTTIAEIAILQSMFQKSTLESLSTSAPLALYLVPSKALATEVESKLSKVLVTLNEPPIVVTGLYGGTDWGPTDAWLTANEPTILICTYEKAEALIRFLGALFLHRVSLIVVDEAHMIQFNREDRKELRTAESRSLRLEALSSRLFKYLDQGGGKVIALSAMATNIENVLARWVTGEIDAIPAKTSYRSTRQLVGRLECLPNRGFRIYYDLLDGTDFRLQFEDDNQEETPYIMNPFPPYPPLTKWSSSQSQSGTEKRLRPYLFWAAMHLASPDERGKQRSVLISITQQISGYAKDFLFLLNNDWALAKLPPFFQPPTDPDKLEKWERCLRSCEDYFGSTSQEYQLLQKGIAVHHGRMPGLMARFLIEVIQEQIVHIVLATSTLSEGVNLPFETILIPSLRRRTADMSVQEFGNLVGRAGRPGFGTEGRSLILLEPLPSQSRSDRWQIKAVRDRYFRLTSGLIEERSSIQARSPLAELLKDLEEQWQILTGSQDRRSFLKWLEQTAPLEVRDDLDEDRGLFAIEALDSLDSLLLATIVEAEQLERTELSASEIEDNLRQIWHRTYAYYASEEESKLEEVFTNRGKALLTNIYPNSSRRRRLYRTSIPPRSGNKLLNKYPEIVEHLKSGEEYASWSEEERFEYIQKTVELIRSLPYFNIQEFSGTGKNRVPADEILRWWLTSKMEKKRPADISTWHKYVSDNFVYRFNWGLGSVISLAIDEANDGHVFEPSLENWPQTGLPWIAIWLKELILWGTLEPVAAYLLAKGLAVTRSQAQSLSALYYRDQSQEQPANELLNASHIRDWAATHLKRQQTSSYTRPPTYMKVRLLRDFNNVQYQHWRVLPVEVDNNIYWFDPAGFPLAVCQKPNVWNSSFLKDYDFELNSSEAVVLPEAYL